MGDGPNATAAQGHDLAVQLVEHGAEVLGLHSEQVFADGFLVVAVFCGLRRPLRGQHVATAHLLEPRFQLVVLLLCLLSALLSLLSAVLQFLHLRRPPGAHLCALRALAAVHIGNVHHDDGWWGWWGWWGRWGRQRWRKKVL